jgi:hypothetical protein
MSRVILIDPCLDPRWDRFVENHPFGWVTHLSAWKRVLESSFPHMRGHYLALVDERNDEIQAGLPLYEVRSAITGNRLVSIPFATLADPLVGNRNQLAVLIEASLGLRENSRSARMEIRAHLTPSLIEDPRLTSQYRYKNHLLRLDKSLDQLMKSFHQNAVQAMIKRSMKISLEFGLAENVSDVKDFYDLYVVTRKRLGLPPQPFRFFLSLWQNLGPLNSVVFPIARLKGRSVAALMLFRFKDRVSWEAVGIDEAYRSQGVSSFLLWEAIKRAHAEGMSIFDLGRTDVDNDGLMTFKNRWGTTVVDLPQFFYSNGKDPGQRVPKQLVGNSCFRRACRALPTPAFTALGRLCYRHMG